MLAYKDDLKRALQGNWESSSRWQLSTKGTLEIDGEHDRLHLLKITLDDITYRINNKPTSAAALVKEYLVVDLREDEQDYEDWVEINKEVENAIKPLTKLIDKFCDFYNKVNELLNDEEEQWTLEDVNDWDTFGELFDNYFEGCL